MPRMRHTRKLLYSTSTRKLELLNTRLCDLGLKLDKSFFAKAIARTRRQMRRAGIRNLKPLFYLSNGYGCVAGTLNISLAFYDATEELRALYRDFRTDQYSYDELYEIVTHEVGHAFTYAYKLYRRKDFRDVFKVRGHFFRTYPESNQYVRRVNPWSRDFVNPSGDHYAQKHPDDDFAETFQYYLSHQTTWQRNYRNYPGALRKLEYVQTVIDELGYEDPPVENDPEWIMEPLEELNQTIREFLKVKRSHIRRLRQQATGFVDPELKYLFRARPKLRGRRKITTDYLRAARFMRAQRRTLVPRVAEWMGVDEVVVADFVEKCIERAAKLDLWLRKDQQEKTLVDLTAFLTMRAGEFLRYDKYYAQSRLD